MRTLFVLAFIIITSNPCLSQEGSYSIKGKLCHGGGDIRKHKNLPIQLFRDGELISEINSDSVGLFIFQNLEPLDYTIHINYFQIDSLISYKTQKPESRILIFLPRICDVSREIALQEIEKGKPRLILVGSIAPTIVIGQEKFEKKFQVQYHDFGCQPPDRSCIEAHNRCVAQYLDKKYGNKWRKYVRKDVQFLEYE